MSSTEPAGPVTDEGPRAATQASLAELVERAVGGDQDAWDTITSRFTNLLWSVARSHRLGTADAGDVVQTTWLRLVEHLGDLREPERLPGWLVVTARNECLSLLRRAGRDVLAWSATDNDDRLVSSLPPLDLDLLQDERDVELWRLFEELPERCRALLRVLMEADGKSYAEVSAAFGMPVGSIGPTRMRCLNQLRRLLDASGYSFDLATES